MSEDLSSKIIRYCLFLRDNDFVFMYTSLGSSTLNADALSMDSLCLGRRLKKRMPLRGVHRQVYGVAERGVQTIKNFLKNKVPDAEWSAQLGQFPVRFQLDPAVHDRSSSGRVQPAGTKRPLTALAKVQTSSVIDKKAAAREEKMLVALPRQHPQPPASETS
ncbi:Hypothetical predicted protein [Cloeon dipterum]|uniref:Uncharacterized protein n=1 Tax=Cloeon dipterum TaxID=197152 RepID=A0A8S1E4V9_9INSE|nr:Hypothetical predicted protein [Cloeon dipterum]